MQSPLTQRASATMSSSKPATGSLGRSLYRRILRELRATRTSDNHLRDIRFLMWVPGTQGKRQFDALKQLAQTSHSLHKKRVVYGPIAEEEHNKAVELQQQQQQAAAAAETEQQESDQQQGGQDKRTLPILTPNPSIADQIRAVARELFKQQNDATRSTSPAARARSLQEGTARAFWAIKRLQDVRAGDVPSAAYWLTGSNKNVFDAFLNARDTQIRSSTFPFLPEFIGVELQEVEEEHVIKKQQQQQQQQQQQEGHKQEAASVLPPPPSAAAAPSSSATTVSELNDSIQNKIDAVLENLKPHFKTSNKILRLEVSAKCAAKEGPSARYHVNFRVENISDAAVDVKLAQLFAVRCESPPVLTEMVSLLPLLGNSILRPESARISSSSSSGKMTAAAAESIAATEDEDAVAGAATTGSLPHNPHRSLSASSPQLKGSTNSFDNRAVYDVSLPVEGECVLRGVVFYRVISNVLGKPTPSTAAADKTANSSTTSSSEGGGGGAAENSNNSNATGEPALPTTVRSRLQAIHFGPIKLIPEVNGRE